MSWTKDVTIWCDGEECGNWYRPGDSKVAKARSNTKGKGWAYRDGQDLCPECQ